MIELIIQEIAVVFAIFFMAAVLHHVIAKTGSILHSIATMGDSQYAVFTFRDDVDLPMSKNILMNIFIPNVALVLLYWFATRMDWGMMLKKLWLFVGFYYLYRALLVCVLLNRKELYSEYELEQVGEGQCNWLTLGDVKLMTGLKNKEILAIQRKNGALILFDETEVMDAFLR